MIKAFEPLSDREIGQIWQQHRLKFGRLYNDLIASYNPKTDFPSGGKAKRINRVYCLYLEYCKFPYLPIRSTS